jgi:hypothetical protein
VIRFSTRAADGAGCHIPWGSHRALHWAMALCACLVLAVGLAAGPADAAAWRRPVPAPAPAEAPADAAAVSPCSQRYASLGAIALPAGLPAEAAVERAFRPYRAWGIAQNVRLVAGDAAGSPALAVHYPEGSAAPSSTAPRGGAGFLSRAGLDGGATAACLAYRLRFAPGFAFNKGGKLPGLYGGDGPSGGAAAANGFSARLMWRRDGAGELYAYLPRRRQHHGESVGRGAWRFPTGRWVSIEQEIVLNTPNAADGVARVWVDGGLRLERRDLRLREHEGVLIEGLMFSTFFGGSDASWASPRDQEALFADFRLGTVPAAPLTTARVAGKDPPSADRPS